MNKVMGGRRVLALRDRVVGAYKVKLDEEACGARRRGREPTLPNRKVSWKVSGSSINGGFRIQAPEIEKGERKNR
jgi:hypothetical protein